MQKKGSMVYLRERKRKVFAWNIISLYFFIACVTTYITVFYFLPYILDISLLLSAIVLGGEVGIIVILTLILLTKIFIRLGTFIKNFNIHLCEQLLHTKNSMQFTHKVT